MKNYATLLSSLPLIEKKINCHLSRKELLAQAFIHKSYLNETKEGLLSNERLEFLGDTVLGLILSSHLYRQYPDVSEGDLSFLRSRLVDASSCQMYIEKLDVTQYMLLGKGERLKGEQEKKSIYADLFEALIGAIFLDKGLFECEKFLFTHFDTAFDEIIKKPLENFKGVFQDYCQKTFQLQPEYQILEQEGPEHQKNFTIAACLEGKTYGIGKGFSKKQAEQNAAEQALLMLKKGSHVD